MSGFHLVRRSDVTIVKRVVYYLVGILISLILGAVLLNMLGINPFKYYKDVVTIGLINNAYPAKAIEGFLKIFTPLLLVSVALALSFKLRFWNVGGEGEFITGALIAAVVAFNSGSLPGPVVILLMGLSAFISAGIIGLAVAFLKVKFNTNETLVTLMINYIMLYVIKFFGETPGEWNFFLDPSSPRPIFNKFPENALMSSISIGSFHLLYSVIITVILAVIIHFYIKKTKQGYEISVVGDSTETAKYAGMNVRRITLRTIFLSAALIGLAGAFTASSAGRISDSITNNVGWTGVIVAWLGKLSIPAIAVTSFLISILQYGCQTASTSFAAIDRNFADLLQGMILFSVLAADFMCSFKLMRKKEANDA